MTTQDELDKDTVSATELARRAKVTLVWEDCSVSVVKDQRALFTTTKLAALKMFLGAIIRREYLEEQYDEAMNLYQENLAQAVSEERQFGDSSPGSRIHLSRLWDEVCRLDKLLSLEGDRYRPPLF